jgi:putative ABC transport system substrate-binding protein
MKRTSLPLRRREFIALLGGAAAWPLAARAQQGELMRRIGVFSNVSESHSNGQVVLAAFRRALQDLGWVEGKNVRVDVRWRS